MRKRSLFSEHYRICGYLKSISRYNFLILGIYHPNTILTWARMWGYLLTFRSQKWLASNQIWQTLL